MTRGGLRTFAAFAPIATIATPSAARGAGMVRTIPHRELRNNSSAILEEVRRGETIHITNHGIVVATLVPPPSAPPLTWRAARDRGDWDDFEIPAPPPGHSGFRDIIDDLRGDR